jgi:hypothetical protein
MALQRGQRFRACSMTFAVPLPKVTVRWLASSQVPALGTTEPANVKRQSASAIDPYAFQLSGWLETESAKPASSGAP